MIDNQLLEKYIWHYQIETNGRNLINDLLSAEKEKKIYLSLDEWIERICSFFHVDFKEVAQEHKIGTVNEVKKWIYYLPRKYGVNDVSIANRFSRDRSTVAGVGNAFCREVLKNNHLKITEAQILKHIREKKT
jgi:hypothetical protein